MAEGSATRTSVILVVEDNPDMADVVHEMLEFSGYEVIRARNGLDGLYRLLDTGVIPHLILCDVIMDELDGYQFLEAVRANAQWIDIPFIFLSAIPKSEDPEYGSLVRANYMRKPFTFQQLLSAVEQALLESGSSEVH